ncbi:membrane protein [Myxococcus stipitatus DSM 14675]|uniref:Membrane protein n=1 Tax=Myxococcus stipitatus (strain DSM 14675 / JCM 12634 / Mx s8) TaxID=1278073 RepID=L7U7A4_MYXSD|nr:membrane protein [Myxococcus stipitatus DSM 14675]
MNPAHDRPSTSRTRLLSLGLAVLVIPLGLASRRKSLPWPAFFATYAGDTLWALLVYLLVRFVAPRRAALTVAAVALTFSFAIEFSQDYHAPWLDAARRTLPGRLVLGAGFLWSDLVCYFVGILVGVGLDVVLLTGRRPDRAAGMTEAPR